MVCVPLTVATPIPDDPYGPVCVPTLGPPTQPLRSPVPKLTSVVSAIASVAKQNDKAIIAFVKNFIVEILYYYSLDLDKHSTTFEPAGGDSKSQIYIAIYYCALQLNCVYNSIPSHKDCIVYSYCPDWTVWDWFVEL